MRKGRFRRKIYVRGEDSEQSEQTPSEEHAGAEHDETEASVQGKQSVDVEAQQMNGRVSSEGEQEEELVVKDIDRDDVGEPGGDSSNDEQDPLTRV